MVVRRSVGLFTLSHICIMVATRARIEEGRKQRALRNVGCGRMRCWLRVSGVVELGWVAGGRPCLCGMGVSGFFIAAYTGARDAGSERSTRAETRRGLETEDDPVVC